MTGLRLMDARRLAVGLGPRDGPPGSGMRQGWAVAAALSITTCVSGMTSTAY
ncbi:hypothetical protein ACFRH4_43770 [Streptomyces mirabilis]|uniref:hypothetical protein n=1 Tax=Streptomyces mirabilis TaxID=68239 RepID=UPI0036AAA2B4